MTKQYIDLEKHFSPGFPKQPLLLFGSQTHEIWHNSAKLQIPEGFFLAGLNKYNTVVVRNIDPNYINYFQTLIGGGNIINLYDVDGGKYLSELVLTTPWTEDLIKQAIDKDYKLLAFRITDQEQAIAKRLHIPFHGGKKNERYGTKDGIRTLAIQGKIPMPPGYVCTTIKEIKSALKQLSESYDEFVIKHSASVSGYLSKKLTRADIGNLDTVVNKLLNRKYIPKEDIFVVEAWLPKTISVGVHIEIFPDQQSRFCAAWQQIIDTDGVSYIGAGPLHLSSPALQSLQMHVQRLMELLQAKKAYGSFGPDFLITTETDIHIPADTAVLIELNARTPYTAFPLEIIKNVKKNIHSGFMSIQIDMNKSVKFADIYTVLKKHKLLVQEQDEHAIGVVPYNVGMLPWKSFNAVAMGNTFEQTLGVVKKTQTIFNDLFTVY